MSGEFLARLESDSPIERKGAVRAILKSRTVPHDAIRSLAEKYIGSDAHRGIVHDAIMLLGRLRAMEQIPWLITRLTYRSTGVSCDRNVPPRKMFPAVGALIEIGALCVDPLLQWVAAHGDQDTRIAARTILRHVLGRGEAGKRVAREVSGATAATAANLTALLGELRRR